MASEEDIPSSSRLNLMIGAQVVLMLLGIGILAYRWHSSSAGSSDVFASEQSEVARLREAAARASSEFAECEMRLKEERERVRALEAEVVSLGDAVEAAQAGEREAKSLRNKLVVALVLVVSASLLAFRFLRRGSDSFDCAECRMTVVHSERTRAAQNSGEDNIYCNVCNGKIYDSLPKPASGSNGEAFGLVGVLVIVVVFVVIMVTTCAR